MAVNRCVHTVRRQTAVAHCGLSDHGRPYDDAALDSFAYLQPVSLSIVDEAALLAGHAAMFTL